MDAIKNLSGNFVFAEPIFLYLLILLAPIFLIWIFAVALGLFSRPEKTYGSKYPLIGKIKLWGFFTLPATFLMITALARPSISGSEIKSSNGDVQAVILFDNSFSMKAVDIKPSRLEIARREILSTDSFLKEGDKVGLFTFGKGSHRKLYLTDDLGIFFDQVFGVGLFENLNDETIFDTDFATALERIYLSLDRQDAYFEGREYNERYNPKKRTNRIVIIFSDGEDQFLNYKPVKPEEARVVAEEKAEYIKRLSKVLAEYRKRGLKIYPVGIGTRRGVSWISLLKGYKKGTDYSEGLEKEWASQITRLDRNNLIALAKHTNVDFSSYDWTVESAQGNARGYLKYALDSNRRPLFELAEGDNSQQLWQYCLLVAAVFLVLGVVTYPFQGYLREK